jgi:hypothetical protein
MMMMRIEQCGEVEERSTDRMWARLFAAYHHTLSVPNVHTGMNNSVLPATSAALDLTHVICTTIT